jgi:FkbM family methyltransferase
MNLLRILAKSLGYELVRRNKKPSMMFHLTDLIELNDIDLVLDVGANNGQFASQILASGFNGEIHSFEPVKNTFEKLQQAATSPLWHVHNFALGEEQGQSEINVTKSSDFASILSPSEYGKKRFKNIKVDYTETIQINTIDNFLRQNITDLEKRRIFLKTDTQGFDLQVLAGAKTSLDLVHCLLSEISLTPIYEGMPHYLDSLKVFESYGFAATAFYPITRNKTNLALIEMDCIMVKKALISI